MCILALTIQRRAKYIEAATDAYAGVISQGDDEITQCAGAIEVLKIIAFRELWREKGLLPVS